MSKRNRTIQISQEDIDFIFEEEMESFEFITSHCFCQSCKKGYESTITNYTISLNTLNDIVLDGICADCNTKISRYIETGDNIKTAKLADAIWETNSFLKELKIKKTK